MVDLSPDLPGYGLVRSGLADLAAGRESEAALLVSMAAPRLRALGLDVPATEEGEPSHRLYDRLRQTVPDPYSRYNALIRVMVSFARAAEHAPTR